MSLSLNNKIWPIFCLACMLCLGLSWCLAHDSMAGQMSFQKAEAAFRGPMSMYVLAALSLVLWAGLGMFKKDRVSESETSQSRQTEEALRRSEEQFRGLVENIPGIIYRCELEPPWRMEHISEESLSLTGHRAEEFMSGEVAWADLVVEDDLAGLSRLVAESVERHKSYMMEYRIRHRDGGIHWVNEKGRAVYDQEGRPLWLNGMILDITQRKQAEEALKQAEQRLGTILDATPLTITITRKSDGKYRHVNKAFSRQFGFTWDEAIGKTPFELNMFVDPGDRQRFLDILDREGKVVDYEMQYRRKDGTIIDVVLFMEQMVLDGEDCLIVTVTDVTERKRAEEERFEYEAQRRQSQKMEAIGTLAGGIAHDFNNILAAMMGYTEITLEDLPDGGLAAENLKQVLKAGYRAKNLVRQILSFSRQSEQEQVPAELGPIVKEAVKLIRASIPSTIEIEQSLDDHGARVLADPIQVHQLVMNLCTNSAQAMPEGGLLQVELRPVNLETAGQSPDLPPGRYLRFTVKDTGQGMDEQTLLRIFDPFFTTKEVDQGTGMGLAVVHGIVEGHEGAITVESSPNRGTAFRVFFPVLEGDAATASPAGQTEMPTGDERILLVDDEETLAELGGKTLERLGYSVKTFTSSPQALEYFQAHPDKFDLVISDYTMPQMTGVRLAQKMLRTRPGLPIIITTGFSQQLSEEKAGTLGIRRVLLKPLSGNRLARIIREVLGETRSA